MTRRVHIGLHVRDVLRSIEFYKDLFGVEPCKRRPGYAKFEVADPPLNLTLNEEACGLHFGVEVASRQAVVGAAERLELAGLPTLIEEQTSCCHSVQDKVWVSDPDGNSWETFHVLGDASG